MSLNNKMDEMGAGVNGLFRNRKVSSGVALGAAKSRGTNAMISSVRVPCCSSYFRSYRVVNY